ncbi:MAG: hypothetical protein OEX18_02030 [Candidatus Krumholzibacteria bacterium]|nr:hypothetical protein [Candidatus Krumholzibacteria bacterium]MDH4336039.1 hypothetical protein [Candidatus Krumholzibacteria bacterium]MDH5268385.1 hypothetical protein [Candidatus Krumholzibacteria bacterium]MDH5627683.1 hypothetical protein [Candidatus Krumholzibacteria bacterium]
MNRNLLLLGTVAAFGLAAAVAGAGDATRISSKTCDESIKTASVSSCCAKGATATAASVEAGTKSCTRGATVTTAAVNDCARSASAVHTADMTLVAAGCDKNAAAAAGGSCDKASAAAAGGDACCKTGQAKTASAGACKAVCEESKTATTFNGAVDELPYRENKRLVLTGTYVCGHCSLDATETCSPLFKTADGKVYPLISNPEASQLRAANDGNGVEIASSVKKLNGIKYLEVKSYKTL